MTIQYPTILRSLKASFFVGLICMGTSLPVAAAEMAHLRQSIRATAMGGAMVAVADDEYALFSNPAGLATFRHVVTDVATGNGTSNQEFIDWMFTSQEGGDELAVINSAIGKTMIAEGNVSLVSMTGPGWAYTAHKDWRNDYQINSLTSVDVSTYLQYGLALGYADSFVDYTLDIGVSWKALMRTSSTVNMTAVELVDSSVSGPLLAAAETTKMEAVGDIGAIYHVESNYAYQTRLGIVVRNVGGLNFGTPIRPSVDIGFASSSEIFGADVVFAGDYVDVTNSLSTARSFMRNTRFGTEVGFNKLSNGHHTVAWRYGMRAGYTSYGFSLNTPYIPLQIDYAKWAEEVGTGFGDVKDSRRSIQISINF